MHRPALALLALVLLVAVVGCTPVSSEAEPGGQPEPDVVEEEAPPEADLSYLTGSWTVATELTSIDNAAMTPAADQPGATWECVVSGETMTLVTDRHEYVGTLAPELENGWVYEASSTYTDEDGHTWTSTIEVHGKPIDIDLESWVGGMTGSIDSDVDGHLYTATWNLTASRM